MTDQDYQPFLGEFERLSKALERYKQSDEDRASRADAYFHALKRLSLQEVVAKADAWLATNKKFPAPVEWLNQIVQHTVEFRELTPAEVAEHVDAEKRGFEREPCSCPQCLSSGVSEKPQRYIPNADRDERDDRVRLGSRITVKGHWAHGRELAGFYQGRADFYEAFLRKFPQYVSAMSSKPAPKGATLPQEHSSPSRQG